MSTQEKIVILGAAGRDFHVFNTCYRDRSDTRVVAFTATQIPFIDQRAYPPELAGPYYPDGIPIFPEDDLEALLRREDVDTAVFAYSDVSDDYVEAMKARVEAAGARFELFDVDATMLRSVKPVIAVCAVRTGCGKSQTTRKIAELLQGMGKKVAAIRHPMPYGNLAKQAVQRFDCLEDLDKNECTIEEREEYEPHIERGFLVYAGVDFEAILREAEKEVDVILWDGGNNDTPFYRPDLYLTVVDPLRPGHELSYFPAKENFERADVIVFNKMDMAKPEGVREIEKNLETFNPSAIVIKAESALRVKDSDLITGKRALVVEDGPTLTHGGMKLGAGTVAAERAGAAELVDPRPWLVGTLRDTFRKYPGIGKLLPAMGYGAQQMKDLEDTINACDCDLVVIGTPIDLGSLIKINKPSIRVGYDLREMGSPTLEEILKEKFHAEPVA